MVVFFSVALAGSSMAQSEEDPSGLCGSWPVPEPADVVAPDLSLGWPTPEVVMRTGVQSHI